MNGADWTTLAVALAGGITLLLFGLQHLTSAGRPDPGL